MPGPTNVVDNRTWQRESWESLPISTPQAAAQAAAQPVEHTVSDAEVYKPLPAKKDEPSYALDRFGAQFGQYLVHHAAVKGPNEYMKQFKAILPALVDSASLLTIGNRPVATFRYDGKLAVERLAKEQPEIYERYLRRVSKLEFDKEEFAAHEPGLFQLYRGRSFRLVTTSSGPILLP